MPILAEPKGVKAFIEIHAVVMDGCLTIPSLVIHGPRDLGIILNLLLERI